MTSPVPSPSFFQPVEVQIFGFKKNADTRKALRFFAERRVKTHFVDLAERAASLGELNRFEGQLPLAVEAAAMAFATDTRTFPFPVSRAATPGARLEIDWRPAVAELVGLRGDAAADAAALHRGLVQAMVAVACEAGAGTVVLTGGCFQNALLHSLASDALRAAGFRVLVHRRLSPNDNSIAAGQALAALLHLTTVDLPA